MLWKLLGKNRFIIICGILILILYTIMSYIKKNYDDSIVEKNNNQSEVEDNSKNKDVINLLGSTVWHEIGNYTYLDAEFNMDGTFNIWDTCGNPCMKGNYSINIKSKTVTLDCSEDEDFDPPFKISKVSTCSFSLTEEGYFCILYKEGKMVFRKDKDIVADTKMKGYIWNACSASDDSDVTGLKLNLGDYFVLYDENTAYFATEHYSIGTIAGNITIRWCGYSNGDGEYKFMYSMIPYVDLEFWDFAEKTLSVDDASDTYEEDMKLQILYTLKEDTLKLEYDGVTLTFTRGVTSREDEVIYQELIGN